MMMIVMLPLLISCASAGTQVPAAIPAMTAQAAAEAAWNAATAEAQMTHNAQDAIARATSDALAVQVTAQAMNATTTAVAQEARATATAQAAIQAATATAQAMNATATTWARNMTATAVAVDAQGTATAATATAQAIQHRSERERMTQPLQTFGPWMLLITVIIASGWTGYRFAQVLEARARVIRRKADEGEPLVLMERDENGKERLALPLRSFYAILTPGEQPPDQFQDKATARQQLANVMLAQAQVGRSGARRLSAARVALPGTEGGTAPTVRVVEPDQVRPWIEDVRAQLVEEVTE